MARRDQERWDKFTAALLEHLNEDYLVLDIPPTGEQPGVKADLAWSTKLGEDLGGPGVCVKADVREFCLSGPSTQQIHTSSRFAVPVHIDAQDQISTNVPFILNAPLLGDAGSGDLRNKAEAICQPKITEMVEQAATRTMSELDALIPYPLREYARGRFEDYEAVESDLPDRFRVPTKPTDPPLFAWIEIEDDQPVVYLPPLDEDYGAAGFKPSPEVARLTFEAAVKVILGT